MTKYEPDDPVMSTVRQRVEACGLTFQALGEKMGYPAESARQAVHQFLKGHDPRVSTLRRFAKAVGMPLSRLVK